jgi:hypothetical protein
MLSLDSARWQELGHAYGAAGDIPALLLQLQVLPDVSGDDEPWFTLWSALAHQGDVYPASFAAVPHVVDALARAPARADACYFQFPAWVEICRVKKGVEVPDDLQVAYFGSLSRLPELAAAAADRPWDPAFLGCVLAAIAAAKGQPDMAEAALELNPEVAREFLGWFFDR